MADQPLDIFNDSKPASTPSGAAGVNTPANAPNNDPFANLLGEIKNERGEPKYSNVNEALNGLKHAQEYIPSLKSQLEAKDAELARLRESVNEINELKNTVAKLTQGKPTEPPTNAPTINSETVTDLVNKAIENRESATKRAANLDTVVQHAKQAFGEKAKEVFAAKAVELGISEQELIELAAKSPKLVLNTLGVQPVDRTNLGTPPKGSLNTSAIEPRSDTFISRNKTPFTIGATSKDIQAETQNAKRMVEELHSKNLTAYDLTDPKVYFKHFG